MLGSNLQVGLCMEKRLLHIYYGDGKGKTTAAVGLAYRCAANGYKVLFTTFLKDKSSGECATLGPFDVDAPEFCGKFWWEMTDDEKVCTGREVKTQFEKIKANISKYDMLVLDEFLDVISVGCVDKNTALEFVNSIYGKAEIIITGHEKYPVLFDIADYITEMKKEKHPYDKGVKCRKGIEY